MICLVRHKHTVKSVKQQRRVTKMRPRCIPQEMINLLQRRVPLIQNRPLRCPQRESVVLRRPPKPTPQRRKMNFFLLNTSTSWWPRFGPKSIRKLKRQFHSTNRARRPASKLLRSTMRILIQLRQRTNRTVR